jgi:O-antigen ligase
MFCSSFDWQKSLLLAGLVVCGILSFAKAILLMVLIGAVIWILFFCRRKKLLIASISALILVTYIGATNFIYLPNPQKPTLGNTFLEEQAKADNSHWVSSSYWALKKAAWISGNRNILLGTGPGNFNDELVELKQEGRYPEHLPLYDPHSVWFGAYAETGILGFLGVLAIIIMALKGILSINYSNPFRFGLLLWLLVFIIEGTNGDLMNFRHYWIQFGLIGGLSLTSKNTSIQASCAGFSE